MPGKKMEVPDFGSRHPIFFKDHELFETEAGSLGICVLSGRVLSFDVKEPQD